MRKGDSCKKKKIIIIATACIVALLIVVCIILFVYVKISEQKKEELAESPIFKVQEQMELMEVRNFSDVYYGYKQLSIEEQKLYCLFYDALRNYKSTIEIPTADKEIIDKVFNCVMLDHPEIFYADGYKYTVSTKEDTIISVKFTCGYNMSKQEVRSKSNQLKESLSLCFSGLPKGSDEYQAVKYFYEYIIKCTEYDLDALNNQNMCSVFLQGRSICNGYAKAMQYCLQSYGIQAFIVTGDANSTKHAWLLVRVNGRYYHIDPTWGDASYLYAKELLRGLYALPLNYDYFLVTTEEVERTHTIESIVNIPRCYNFEDNYFRREGLYFSKYDEAELRRVFDTYYTMTDGYINIKCESLQLYNEFMQELIQSQRIFSLTNKATDKLSYTSDQYQRTLSFWNFR